MNLANEGLEARKKEEEVATRKRKAEDDKKWEGEHHDPQYSTPHGYSSPSFTSTREPRTACRQLENIHQRLEEEEEAEGHRTGLIQSL